MMPVSKFSWFPLTRWAGLYLCTFTMFQVWKSKGHRFQSCRCHFLHLSFKAESGSITFEKIRVYYVMPSVYCDAHELNIWGHKYAQMLNHTSIWLGGNGKKLYLVFCPTYQYNFLSSLLVYSIGPEYMALIIVIKPITCSKLVWSYCQFLSVYLY